MIGAEDSERHRISSDESTTSEPLRHDLYEDYDELADLAITFSEPPPPGTTSFQEDLMSLITDNTAPGVSIDKKEIATWLQDEDAMLMGREEEEEGRGSRQRSASVSSMSSFSSSHDGSDSELRSPPQKLSSVAFKSRDTPDESRRPSRSSSRGEEEAEDEEGRQEPVRRIGKEKVRSKTRTEDSSSRGHNHHHRRRSHDTARRHRRRSSSYQSRHHRRHTRDTTCQRSRRASGTHRHRTTSPPRSSRRTSPRRIVGRKTRSPERTVSRIEIKGSSSSRRTSRVGSPSLSSHPKSRRSPDGSRLRRVKIARKVDNHDRNNSKFYHHEEEEKTSPRRTIHGVRDARELISTRAPSQEETGISMGQNMIRKLEEQIRINELEARRLAREARHAKQKMDEYLSLTLHREITPSTSEGIHRQNGDAGDRRGGSRDRRGGNGDQGSRSSRRKNPSEPDIGRVNRKRPRQGSSRHENGVGGGHRRRHSDDHDANHVTRRREHSVGSGGSRHGTVSSRSRHTSPDDRTTDPKDWKLLRSSEVEGFNITGPTVFVQNLSRGTRRGHLFSHFKTYGSIVDIQFFDLHKEKTACVIFSRKSESEKVFDDYNGDTPKIINVIHPVRENKFDVLLNALRRSEVS